MSIAGLGYYLHSSLSKVTSQRGAQLRALSYRPLQTSSALREVNLGYASLKVPDTLNGPIEQMDGTLFVCLGRADSLPKLTFCPPISDADPAFRNIVEQFNVMSGESLTTWFAFRKRMLNTEPFNLFQAVMRGRQASIRDATLLTLKSLTFARAHEFVRVFEDDTVGMFSFGDDSTSFLDIYDKEAKVSQAVFIAGTSEQREAVTSSVALSYRIRGMPKSEADFLELMHAAGIPNVSSTANVAATKPEQQRLSTIADEIRRRRTIQTK